MQKYYTTDTHGKSMTANYRPADGQNEMIDSTIWPCEKGGGPGKERTPPPHPNPPNLKQLIH